MSTCNRLDLETLGSRPVMLKILPQHCTKHTISIFCFHTDFVAARPKRVIYEQLVTDELVEFEK